MQRALCRTKVSTAGFVNIGRPRPCSRIPLHRGSGCRRQLCQVVELDKGVPGGVDDEIAAEMICRHTEQVDVGPLFNVQSRLPVQLLTSK